MLIVHIYISNMYYTITYDVIKLTGPLFDEQIHILFNRILQEKMWPRGFQISLLKSLFKKGRRDLMVNYRGITLSSTLGKWFSKTLYSGMIALAQEKNWMGSFQSGFTPGCQTSDKVMIVRTLLHKAK